MSAKETSENQRRAYQRDGRLGRVYFPDAMTKTKPKYQPAPPPNPPKPPRKGGDNVDKGYYKSSNPAKNRAYPGTVGQFGKALEQAYERGRADGARIAGAKTTSIKGRIPLVRQAPARLFSSTGQRIAPTGGGVGRGGARGEFRTGGGGGGEGGILKRKVR